MTVRELKAMISNWNDDSEVFVAYGDEDGMDIIGYDENDVSYFILFESEKK
jgi:hypothetical protein